MMLNRRQFGQSLLALSALAGSGSVLATSNTTEQRFIASASKDANGKYWLHVLDAEGNDQLSLQLPERAHQVRFHPTQPWAVATGRRPGYYLWIANYLNGEVPFKISPEPGYHFYGHSAFSEDGNLLYTTENHIDSGEGRVFVRDLTQQAKVIGEYASGGIGPHQLELMPDGKTLVIANGGILTLPEEGRDKLNLDTMDPSLAYLDTRTGELVEQVRLKPEYHQLSIRHLDVNAEGKIIIALQYQGSPIDQVPLVATHLRGEAMQTLWAPTAVNQAMKQYGGSACFDLSGRFAMVSCPKGDLVTLWDVEKNQYVDQVRCRDGCGLASAKSGEFLISNGVGRMYAYDMLTGKKQVLPLHLAVRQSWDNHMGVI